MVKGYRINANDFLNKYESAPRSLRKALQQEGIPEVLVMDNPGNFKEYLFDHGYNTRPMLAWPKGSDYVGVKDNGKTFAREKSRHFSEKFCRVLDKVTDACSRYFSDEAKKMFHRANLLEDERIHVIGWDLSDKKIAITAHKDPSPINLFFEPIETLRAHGWLPKKDGYDAQYQKAAEYFYKDMELSGI